MRVVLQRVRKAQVIIEEKKSEEIRAELLEETVETVEDPVSPSWIPKLFRRN